MVTVVNFSGGRTSAYMAYKLKNERPDLKLAYVFANTGKEREETLSFINECDQRWNLGIVWIESVVNQTMGEGVSYKIVDYHTASRNGGPFSDLISKFGIPNKDSPHCTRDLKTRPIDKWVNDTFGIDYQMAIGFRADEKKRAKFKPKTISH